MAFVPASVCSRCLTEPPLRTAGKRLFHHPAEGKTEVHGRSATPTSSVLICQGLMACEDADAMGSSVASGAELELISQPGI